MGSLDTGWPYPEKDDVEIIKANYDDKDWIQDPSGYFTIKPFYKEKMIAVRFYDTNHKRKYLIYGDNAREIYNTLAKMKLFSRVEHASYLGKELMKAEIALKNNLHFNQDEDLDLNKKANEEDFKYNP